MKRPLRHPLEGEKGGGRVPESSVVAMWRHFAAGWIPLALRGRSEVLAQTVMQREVYSIVMGTVVCWCLLVLVFVLDVLQCCE
jgi:hypothetical protein